MKLLTALAIVASLPAFAAAQPANTPALPSIAGSWVGTWGPTSFTQDGDHVRGVYAYHSGRIDGTLRDRMLTFTWAEDDGTGRGVFTIADDGSLRGTWGSGDSDNNGGEWTLQRADASTTLALGGIGGGAVARPSTWITQLRMPWDIYVGRSLEVGWIGLGLDIGRRVGSHWYVGATGDVEWMSLVSLDTMSTRSDASDNFARLRLGGEVRYYFADGTGAARVNHGPWMPIPRHTWIGLRAGAESFDGFGTIGQFGDFALGTSFDLGGTSIGLYGAFGASRQPGATGNALGGTIGMSLAFGS